MNERKGLGKRGREDRTRNFGAGRTGNNESYAVTKLLCQETVAS